MMAQPKKELYVKLSEKSYIRQDCITQYVQIFYQALYMQMEYIDTELSQATNQSGRTIVIKKLEELKKWIQQQIYTPLKWTRSSDPEIDLIEAIIDKKVGKSNEQFTKVFKSISKEINDPNTQTKEEVLCVATNHYCEYLLEKVSTTTNKS